MQAVQKVLWPKPVTERYDHGHSGHTRGSSPDTALNSLNVNTSRPNNENSNA